MKRFLLLLVSCARRVFAQTPCEENICNGGIDESGHLDCSSEISIPPGAFQECNGFNRGRYVGTPSDGFYIGVKSVTFGSSLENIGANAFDGSTLAGNLDLSVATNRLTIGTKAFYLNTGITSVTFGSSLDIGNWAFYGCTKLTGTLDLTNATTLDMGDDVFGGTDITKVLLACGESVRIGANDFPAVATIVKTSTDPAPCFPSSAMVQRADGETVPLSSLSAGDSILAAAADGTLGLDTVSSFSLADPSAKAAFLSLATATATVTLTPTHKLPAGPAKALKQASEVAVGETVWLAAAGALVQAWVAPCYNSAAVVAANKYLVVEPLSSLELAAAVAALAGAVFAARKMVGGKQCIRLSDREPHPPPRYYKEVKAVAPNFKYEAATASTLVS
ncbi:hypothetical protein EMIHUDRAFT_200974 [Emiliania huxleyi CCMP1516]|uniref:Hint domain-containing protein n=2 Tax=Emiliania huxleyi TaxID=2903 RepID=A0A0D3KLY4_EMIH1|nr:hypothetical protein EMIHUDRAFT_200974 [Emiliania huxleyi CCMP1516]EOD36769.1 hypothetical protein EMIHUDRAFT_200974 [Emiliania huxleyi CCMP1516]|eukprot:XP_005789198.1 hypothetical protein EMIHUDRAFT_200974 [Emiliania huxleyi CCMP1516]